MDASFEGGNGCYFGKDGTKWTVEIPQSGSFNKSSKEIRETIHEFLTPLHHHRYGELLLNFRNRSIYLILDECSHSDKL